MAWHMPSSPRLLPLDGALGCILTDMTLLLCLIATELQRLHTHNIHSQQRAGLLWGLQDLRVPWPWRMVGRQIWVLEYE